MSTIVTTVTLATVNSSHLEQAAGLGRDDEHLDAPATSVHLNAEMARVLLTARGWTLEPEPGGNAYVKPGGRRRGDGGQFGKDYLWDLDDALALALRAEAIALGAEA